MDSILPIKYILGYMTGTVFAAALIIYMYLLIMDNLEHDEHSTEETSWMYGFLAVLIIGFITSMYLITTGNQIKNTEIDEVNSKLPRKFGSLSFEGRNLKQRHKKPIKPKYSYNY